MVERAGLRSLARVRRFDLDGGSRLLIGRDIETRTPLRALLTSALLWSLLVLVVLGTVGGLVMQNLFRRMIASVSSTAVAIAQGDLGRRVRLSGRGDEFDRLAEVINDMLDRTARLMDGVRQVSNSIAHDLRTPIARARARLEDAATHAESADELRAAVDRAVVDLDGVAAVFKALLRIAEIEAGARRSAFAPLDAAELLAGLDELYEVAAEEHGGALVMAAPGPLLINGDRDLIQQAVANLLDNAIKFSPEGGTIAVRATAGEAVEIAVSDQGPGIPAADRHRATDRFFRGEAARQTPGSGLGLALVEAVAQLHGGCLRLEDAAPGLRARAQPAADAACGPSAAGEDRAFLNRRLPSRGRRANRMFTRSPAAAHLCYGRMQPCSGHSSCWQRWRRSARAGRWPTRPSRRIRSTTAMRSPIAWSSARRRPAFDSYWSKGAPCASAVTSWAGCGGSAWP